MISDRNNNCVLCIKCLFMLLLMPVLSSASNKIFPKPTGIYTIGTYSFIKEIPKTKGENAKILSVKVWYPSDSIVNSSNYNNYLEDYNLKDLYSSFKHTGILYDEMLKLNSYKTYSTLELPPSNKKEKFPLIIFIAGYYFGANDIYTAFIENLASNGYIVMAVAHVYDQIVAESKGNEDYSIKSKKASLPYLQMWWHDKTTFRSYNKPKNQEKLCNHYLNKLKSFDRIINKWESSTISLLAELADNKLLLSNRLNEKIDYQRIGIMGQSLGGALANHMCVNNNIIKAAVNIDGFQFGCVSDTTTNKNIMLIEGDQQIRWRIGNEYIYRNYPNLEYVRIKGAKHFLFSDLPCFSKFMNKEIITNLIGSVNGTKQIELVNNLILNFFNISLQGIQNTINYIETNQYLYQKTNRCIYLN